MHTKLTIPERLKDLRVSEKRMSLQELSDATGIPSSTLGNYEKDENIDMSLGNLITLANFYNVSTDYLLCRTELRKHKNQSVSDLHLNDDAVQILTDEKYNPRLLSELLTHENFWKFMTDLEIYIDGFNDKGIQIANAFLDVMRCKLTELGADSTDAFATKPVNHHITDNTYKRTAILFLTYHHQYRVVISGRRSLLTVSAYISEIVSSTSSKFEYASSILSMYSCI